MRPHARLASSAISRFGGGGGGGGGTPAREGVAASSIAQIVSLNFMEGRG